MCLSKVTNRKPEAEGIGWKIFKMIYCYGGSLQHTLKGQYFSTRVLPRKTWLREVHFRLDNPPRARNKSCDKRLHRRWLDKKIAYDQGNTKTNTNKIGFYPTGWHIWVKRPSCYNVQMDEIVKKVKYRRAKVEGVQGDKKVVVAKEIWIF